MGAFTNTAHCKDFGVFLLLCLVSCAVSWAQDPAPPSYILEQIKAGSALYVRSCAICHGAQGDQVSGVGLMRGLYIQSSLTEEGVKQTIEKGFLKMPALNLSDAEATEVVGYLHDMQFKTRTAPPPGDGARGKVLVERSQCLDCHRVGKEGSYTGPNLTGILEHGRSATDLRSAILDPDSLVPPEDRYVRLVTADGKTMTGRLLNRDAFTVEFVDTGQQLRSVPTSGLREYTVITKGLMPPYSGKLSSQDVADIINYLASVKGN